MIINLTNYIKNNFFLESEIPGKICILSDYEIKSKYDFFKIKTTEPVGQILALKEKYDKIFIILDKLNYDNIYRLYKNNVDNICILNLNSGYTGIGKKIINPDLDDIYIRSNIEILEPMDLENFKFYIFEFLENGKLTHIRIANKEMEEKIGEDQINFDYKEIINFNQFGIQGFSGTILVYGSMLQEGINVAGLLQSEGIGVDMFWLGNYKISFNKELIESLENQEKVFIVGNFEKEVFKDIIYSNFYKYGVNKEEIFFITPENINKEVFDEILSESVNMNPQNIYNRIRKNIE